MSETAWYPVDPGPLEVDRIATVVVAGRAVCITRTVDGFGALDNRCPHQEARWATARSRTVRDLPMARLRVQPVQREPAGRVPRRGDRVRGREARGRPVRRAACPRGAGHADGPGRRRADSWGIDTVFGMVGHSNLGLAEALRRAEEAGRLWFIGIRHEGAAAFAASGYAKLTGRPAACFSIAGPGATNLLTGLWDAKVDRAPILGLTGRVQTQVLGPGAFQEVPFAAAFDAVSEWSQTVLSPANASELAAFAVKHAVVNRDVAT